MKALWTLRLLALALIAIVALKPVAVRPDPGAPTGWALLLDTSASMRVADPTPRFDRARQAANALFKSVSGLKGFSFAERSQPLDRDGLESLSPTGKKSDLAGAIAAALAPSERRGAILLTDGRQVGAGDVLSQAAAAGKPLFIVGFGDRSRFRDVAVRAVQSPPFAFKNVSTALSATIAVVGYPGKQVTVRLREGEKILGIQNVQVSGDDVETTVAFSWVPTSVGTKLLTVEAEPFAGEATTLNNRKEIALDVGRDRFRVLYICGVPGPEYGFLRHQFKSDPAVELVTFVILRNAGNVLSVPETELSLIPFPTQDVLINQMATFDLVVFEEFAYQTFGLMPTVVRAIRQKVLDGGSFLLMGGPIAFGPGSPYAIPGIEEMIPVNFGSTAVRVADGAVPFSVTAPNHPIVRLEENIARNQALWKALPPLEAVTLVPSAKPGATVLGTANVDGVDHPVLTVWKHGKGRVAALTARTTWRWSMVPTKSPSVADAYSRFWKNMVLWLTHSDEFKTVRAAFDTRDLRAGDTSPLHVWVYDEYFKPVSDAQVQLQVTYPDGKTAALASHVETTGVFEAPFKAEQLGTHQIHAVAFRNGKPAGEDTLHFRVLESQSEDEDLRPDFDTLKELARATGGRFLTSDQFSPSAFREFNDEIQQKTGRKVLLWNSPWLLAAIVILLIIEWAWRRRRGLP